MQTLGIVALLRSSADSDICDRRLQLKSAIQSSSNDNIPGLTPKPKSPEYVYLCSEDLEKSWSVRQVSTSNEVYVVEALPRAQDAASGDITMSEAGDSTTVLTAIAKTDSMLELLPASIDIESYLRMLLPTYDHDQLTRLFEKSDPSSFPEPEEQEAEFTNIVSQIPAPSISICKIWRQLRVGRCPRYSATSQDRYFIPNAQLLESAWKSVHAAYNIRTSRNEDMEKADFEDDGEEMDELVPVKSALWTYLSSPDGWSLDREKTVSFVVRNQLEAMWTSAAPGRAKTEDRSELEDLWRDLLPREWSDDASIDKLQAGTYELYVEYGREMVRWKGQSNSNLAASITEAKPGKRKWHERFRDSRNGKT